MAIPAPSPLIAVIDSGTAVASTNERTSSIYTCHPGALECIVYVFSTEAGTLDIDRRNTSGTWQEIHTEAVAADTLTIIQFEFNPLIIRTRFTPSTQPVTYTVEAQHYGHSTIA